MTDKQLFFPTAYRQDKSRIDGKTYHTIWFEHVNTGKDCQTYVHRSCRNHVNWDNIISKLNNTDMFVSFDPLIWKDENKGLIDADSLPVIELEADKGDIAKELRQHRMEQDQKPRKNKKVKPLGQFGELFDIEE